MYIFTIRALPQGWASAVAFLCYLCVKNTFIAVFCTSWIPYILFMLGTSLIPNFPKISLHIWNTWAWDSLTSHFRLHFKLDFFFLSVSFLFCTELISPLLCPKWNRTIHFLTIRPHTIQYTSLPYYNLTRMFFL